MTKICALDQTVGLAEACPASACPFWEPGGAVLSGRCAFDPLDLSGRPDVAAELRRIRALRGSKDAAAADRDARHLFHHLLDEGEAD